MKIPVPARRRAGKRRAAAGRGRLPGGEAQRAPLAAATLVPVR